MNGAFHLRPAVAADHDAWLEMVQEFDPYVADPEIGWRRVLSGAVTCWIQEYDGAPAGFVQHFKGMSAFVEAPICYLSDLYVKPEFRRQGYGRFMIDRVIEMARTAKYDRVYWFTRSDNPARKLYDEYEESEFVYYNVFI